MQVLAGGPRVVLVWSSCGPRVFFYVNCFEEAHSVTNIFHTGEIFELCIKSFIISLICLCILQNGMYQPKRFTRTIDVRNHACSSATIISLCCISENGG